MLYNREKYIQTTFLKDMQIYKVLLMETEVKLIKTILHKRTDCGCGVALIPIDPSPDITKMVRDIVKEYGILFKVIDASAYPEILDKYGLKTDEMPALVIGDTPCKIEEQQIRRLIEDKL